jgi:hypothetical protein
MKHYSSLISIRRDQLPTGTQNLEEIFKVPSSHSLELGYIDRKSPYSVTTKGRYQAESKANKIKSMVLERVRAEVSTTFCQIHVKDFHGLTLASEEGAPIKPSKHLTQFHAANQQEIL